MRGLRLVMTSVAVLGIAAGAHVLGGGERPDLLVAAALLSLVVLVATVLSRWRLRLWTLVPALGGLQLVVHGVLSVVPSSSHVVMSDAMVTAGHAHGHAHASSSGVSVALGATPSWAAPQAHAMGSSSTMLLVHVAATLVTAALLVATDRAARAAMHWWTAALVLISPLATQPVTALRAAVIATVGLLRPRVEALTDHHRRGPPMVTAAA